MSNNCAHFNNDLTLIMMNTYWLAGTEFNPPIKPIRRHATRMFFSDQNEVDDGACIDPHTPFLHISSLPALSEVSVTVCCRRKSPSLQEG